MTSAETGAFLLCLVGFVLALGGFLYERWRDKAPVRAEKHRAEVWERSQEIFSERPLTPRPPDE